MKVEDKDYLMDSFAKRAKEHYEYDDYYINLADLETIVDDFISNRLEKLVMQLPGKEEILKTAVTLSDNLTANEQAFFVAGFQECIKYLQERQSA